MNRSASRKAIKALIAAREALLACAKVLTIAIAHVREALDEPSSPDQEATTTERAPPLAPSSGAHSLDGLAESVWSRGGKK